MRWRGWEMGEGMLRTSGKGIVRGCTEGVCAGYVG